MVFSLLYIVNNATHASYTRYKIASIIAFGGGQLPLARTVACHIVDRNLFKMCGTASLVPPL